MPRKALKAITRLWIFFRTKFFFELKFFDVGSKVFLDKVFFWTKIIFSTKIFFRPKFFFVPNFLDQNLFLDQKFCVEKNFWFNKIFGPKKFEGWGQNLGIQLFDLYEAYIPNLGLIRSLEPFEKFSVGGGGWWSTVSLVFCFGPKLWFRT